MPKTLIAATLIFAASSAAAEMTVTSASFEAGGTLADAQVFAGFGCDGGNLSPALSWSGAPEGTQSYVVMAYDPDAPTGSGWWHWAAFDIPAFVTTLPEGIGTDGVETPAGMKHARNDFSQNGFGGACPPEGAAPHRYQFTVFAMPAETLGLDETASSALLGFVANANALDRATIEATYGR